MVDESSTTYMLVLLTSMTETDQTTYVDYPERFGKDAFTGQMGMCKIVPTDGPERVYSNTELELASQGQEVTDFLKNINLIPEETTVAQVLQAMLGRSSEEDLTNPTTYEDAEDSHPTVADYNATPANLASALAAALETIPT